MVLATRSGHGISGLNYFIHEIAEEPFWLSNKSDNAVLEVAVKALEHLRRS